MSNPNELNELIAKYEKLYFLLKKSQGEINKLNKLAEKIGETSADIEIRKKFGSLVKKEVSIPIRGQSGAPILDKVYELTNGNVIVVEAKYNNSLRGRVNETVFAADDISGSGAAEKIVLKKEIEQLSGPWLQARIAEIRKYDKDLANKLNNAIQNGKLKVFEYRAKQLVDGKNQKIAIKSLVVDETKVVNDYFRIGRQLITDKERSLDRQIAKEEGFLKRDFDLAKAKLNKLNSESTNARKLLKRKLKEFEAADKKLKNVKKLQTKSKYAEIVDTKLRELADARKKYEIAENAASKASEDVALLSKNLDSIRGTQKLRIANQGASKPAQLSEAALERNVVNKAINLRGVDKIGADTVGTAKTVNRIEEVGSKASKVVKTTSRFKSFARFAFKGAKLFVRIGKFAFLVYDFIDSLFMAVDIVDSLLDWLQSEKIEEKKEWIRIIYFLFGEVERIKTVYGLEYLISLKDSVFRLIEIKLSDFNYVKNYLFWLNKWDDEHNWQGFVYSQINVNLERQTRLQADKDEPYNVKYYLAGSMDIYFTDKPLKNSKKERFINNAGSQDDRNFTTGGRQPPYSSPEYAYSVEISSVEVRYTYPIPTLTPFDFIIVKCRSLISEIVAFLSRYDGNIIEGMDIREEANEFLKIYWLENYKFSNPLNNDTIHFCIKAIFWAIDNLSSHVIQHNDLAKKEISDKFNIGFNRRLQILFKLSKPKQEYKGKSIFYEIGLSLNNIVNDLNERHLIKPINNELKDLTNEYLRELAFDIDRDLKRTFENCKKNSQFEYILN